MTNPLATKIQKPSCIDFILTNSSLRFYRNDILLTRFSDCDKLVLLLKQPFQNQNQRKLLTETLKNLIKNFVISWLNTIAHLRMYL